MHINPVFPIIYESVFGEDGNPEFTARDAAINSDLLQLICERLLSIKLHEGEFSANHAFRLRIEDQHDDETQPHYVLDVGNSPHKEMLESQLVVDYCDNYSDKDRTIKQARGKFAVFASERIGNYTGDLQPRYWPAIMWSRLKLISRIILSWLIAESSNFRNIRFITHPKP